MIFLFSGTKVTPHRVFVKGRFTLRVKNLLCSLRSCGYFLPFALDKYSVLRWQVFRKKEKTLVMMLFKIVGLMVWAIY